MIFRLRPYQELAIEEIRKLFASGKRRVLLVMPTGAGKTVAACFMIEGATAKGLRVLYLAHRKELIDQPSAKLDHLRIPHGVMMGSRSWDSSAPVQVASVQTAIRRDFPAPDLIICDECHHSPAGSYQSILDRFPNAFLIGLTATPFRADGQGLGDTFSAWVRAATINELTDLGFLVPARYWEPSSVDMKGVRTKGSDWDGMEVAEKLRGTKIMGDVISHWKTLADGERTVLFAPTTQYSREVVDQFNQAGIPAEHLDYETGRKERTQILANLARGKTLIVSNVGILTEGWDSPAVTTLVSLRPTQSLVLWLQMIGRVLRSHPGKNHAKIIDHVGNIRRHGFATTSIPVDLSTGCPRRKEGDPAPALRTCPKCFAVLPASAVECPCCWHRFDGAPPRRVIQKDGTLEEIFPVCVCGSYDTVKKPHELHGTGLYCAKCDKWLRWLGKNTTPEAYFKKMFELQVAKGWKERAAEVRFKIRYGRWPTEEDRRLVQL